MGLLDKLKLELGRRIKRDMEPLGHWNEKEWFKTTLGQFYGSGVVHLPIIHRVVGECVDNILKPDWQMTVAAWNGLQRAIDGTDTSETALPDMVRAALQVDPRSFKYFEAGLVADAKPKAANSTKPKAEPRNGKEIKKGKKSKG